MARKIHGGYHEDAYHKYECQACKRCFIVGETLSKDMRLACPYCRSEDISLTAASADEAEDAMDMGCLGIYFTLYDDGGLMLYTEDEFAQALKGSLEGRGEGGIPLAAAGGVIGDYCAKRDGRHANP